VENKAMCSVLSATPTWLDSHQYLALWIEGIALLLIFIWDRWDSHQQYKETLAQIDAMRRQADLIAGQNELLKESVSVAKDGAEAARANAQAAVLNAQAIINSERPWIVVSVRPDHSIGSYIFMATNKGRTPAVFESGTFDFCFESYPDTLPTRPTYASRFVPYRTLIVQEDEFRLPIAGADAVNPGFMVNHAELRDRIKSGNQSLIFYGRVIYKDILGKDTEPIRHETCFCYRFDFGDQKFVRTGPEEYNRYT
jgi:hypothetical protein